MNTCLLLLFLTSILRIYSWLLDWRERRARECVGLWISVTHFRCFIPSVGIRFDKVELNINVITGGFCCCQDFFSHQLRVESSVYLAKSMMWGHESWLVLPHRVWRKFHCYIEWKHTILFNLSIFLHILLILCMLCSFHLVSSQSCLTCPCLLYITLSIHFTLLFLPSVTSEFPAFTLSLCCASF